MERGRKGLNQGFLQCYEQFALMPVRDLNIVFQCIHNNFGISRRHGWHRWGTRLCLKFYPSWQYQISQISKPEEGKVADNSEKKETALFPVEKWVCNIHASSESALLWNALHSWVGKWQMSCIERNRGQSMRSLSIRSTCRGFAELNFFPALQPTDFHFSVLSNIGLLDC